jgi:hypothetical protein
MISLSKMQARETATHEAHTLGNTVQFRGLLPFCQSTHCGGVLLFFSLVIPFALAVTASKAASGNSFIA